MSIAINKKVKFDGARCPFSTFLRLQGDHHCACAQSGVIFHFWSCLKAGPLDLSFWSFLTFLHHGIEEVERHLLWKFHKKIQRKSWSNVPPKLLACIRLLYKVVHYFIAWTIFMKLGTLVHHVHGYKTLPQNFSFLPRDLVMVFQRPKTG